MAGATLGMVVPHHQAAQVGLGHGELRSDVLMSLRREKIRSHSDVSIGNVGEY